MIELVLATPDPLDALFECAYHGLPGPLLSDNECGAHTHVVILEPDSDTESLVSQWAHSDQRVLAFGEVGF